MIGKLAKLVEFALKRPILTIIIILFLMIVLFWMGILQLVIHGLGIVLQVFWYVFSGIWGFFWSSVFSWPSGCNPGGGQFVRCPFAVTAYGILDLILTCCVISGGGAFVVWLVKRTLRRH